MATDDGAQSRKKPKLEDEAPESPLDAARPAPAPAADQDQVVGVAPNGDLVLLVGPAKRALRVHSFLVKLTLRPLADSIDEALYNAWAAPGRLAVVALPDDDPTAVMVVCGLLHSSGANPGPGPVRGDVLLAVARTVSKYECAGRVFFATDYWLRRAFTVSDPGDHAASWKFLVAACLLGNEEWFYHFSNRLSIFHRRSFLAFTHDAHGPERVLALRLALALEEKRSRDRASGYRAPATLCIGCFTAATASFLPSETCTKCTAAPRIVPAQPLVAPAPGVQGVQRALAPVMSVLGYQTYPPAPPVQGALRAPAPGQPVMGGRPIAPAPTFQGVQGIRSPIRAIKGVQGIQIIAAPGPPVQSGQNTAPIPAPNDAE